MALDNDRNDRIAAARDGAIRVAQQAHEAGHLSAQALADKIAELDLIARSAGWAPPAPDPRTPAARAADARLPDFSRDQLAGRSSRSPLATNVAGGYAAAGLADDVAEFAAATHLQAGAARVLAAAVKSERPVRRAQLLAAYTDGAATEGELVERRIEHEIAATEILAVIPGAFAKQLAALVDRLPRSVLSSIIRTGEIKAEVAKLRGGR